SLTARTAILGRVARSSALALTLAADAERRPRARLEPFGRDLVAAIRARPVRPIVDALQRAVDLREDVLGVLLERVVELAVVRHGRGVRALVVVARVLAVFVADRARVLLVQVVDRRLHTLTLLPQEVAETVGVGHAHACSFAAASPSRRSARASSIPASSTILSLLPCPETTETAPRDTETVSAMSRTTAAFARPSSGGAVTWIFQPSPCLPIMRDRVAPGDTRRCNRAGFTALSLALRRLSPGSRDVILHRCERRAKERAHPADLAEQPVVVGARVTRD